MKHNEHHNSVSIPVNTVKNRKNPYQIDKPQVRRAFNQAASRYDQSALLQQTVGKQLFERLALMNIQPATVLDVGAGTGYLTQQVMSHYPQADFIALDIAEQMLITARGRLTDASEKATYLCADAEKLPLASASIDCVYSNLALQWSTDLPALFSQIYRVLKPGGFFVFSTLGPDTLHELKSSWASVSEGIHAHAFIDMHHVGDALLGARFQDPVVDCESITMHYQQVIDILRDLKGIGAHNATLGRTQGLMGKQQFQAFVQAYEQKRTESGFLPVTYEVVYGLGLKAGKTCQEIQRKIAEIN